MIKFDKKSLISILFASSILIPTINYFSTYIIKPNLKTWGVPRISAPYEVGKIITETYLDKERNRIAVNKILITALSQDGKNYKAKRKSLKVVYFEGIPFRRKLSLGFDYRNGYLFSKPVFGEPGQIIHFSWEQKDIPVIKKNKITTL